jgi:site-specific recombinase XerD
VLRVSPFTIMKGPTHSVVEGKPMTQAMSWEMLQRRAKAADIDTVICNHTFRADGITAYLIHGGTLDEIEKIRFV